ncbi:MAG: sigma-70 family RNA polymerase sigma factor [Anaerolineae bacterium]|nr:sigma-70 family RNA polymerase sigma factor [Anaerolineae bacterium]
MKAIERDYSTPHDIDWAAVYAENLPKIYNYFRYRLGPGPEAEDLTATTFEKAWRGRRKYRRDRAGFSTWLFAIARNVAVDYFRRQHPTQSLDEAGVDVPAMPRVDETVERRMTFAHLQRLLAQLPERERELVALKYGAALTNRKIAELTGLSESNVGTILHRVVARLRRQWEEEDER